MNNTLLLLYTAGEQHLKNLHQIAPEWDILHTTEKMQAEKLIEDAEVVMGNHNLCESLPFNKKKLKWVQTNSVGIDLILKKCGNNFTNIALTNARGVYNDEICEHTIALILLMQRNLHLIRDAQMEHNWQRPQSLPLLSKKNILIIGYGSLGYAIGEKLKVFGCNIFGINTDVQHININNKKLFWKDALPYMDIIIVCLPLTQATKNYLGKDEIEKLSTAAIIINIGRAGTIDEASIYKRLLANNLRGAALDVFVDEPLPSNHPAWDIKNLFISPHMARSKEITSPFQFEKLFEENFERYIKNEPLLNIVDITKGY